MKKTIKKVLAAVLAATMVIGMMAVSAFAADTDGYHVCGSAGLCGTDWDTSANLMNDNGDGTYSLTFTGIAAGTYEFKVELNNWEEDWNLEGTASGTGGGNAVLEITEDNSTVVISFDGEKASVEVNPAADDEPAGDTPTGDASHAALYVVIAAAAAAVLVVAGKKRTVEE